MTAAPRFVRKAALGAGGMGEVWIAEDTQTGADVALKVLREDVDADILARFERECRLLTDLSHPNILPALAWGRLEDGAYYYTMPLVPRACTLTAWIATHAGNWPPPADEVVPLVQGVAAALDHVHARGILHRDVKPSNILVRPDGTAVLIDFGLAGMVSSALTRTGVIVGTMNYLAPEQAEDRELSPATDVYALGLVLHEIATGAPAARDATEYIKEMCMGRRPFPPPSTTNPRVGDGLEDVILKATQLAPASRWPSAGALAAALAAVPAAGWLANGVSGSVTAPPPELAPPPRDVASSRSQTFTHRYRIVRELGRGAMGTVLLGEDAELKRTVAIKFLHRPAKLTEQLLKRFEREVQTLARVSHPNVVKVFDVGIDEQQPFIVFEHVSGQSLQQLIDAQGPLAPSRVRALALALLDGIAELHDKGVIHRDLKPANVLVEGDRVTIIDLGLARLTDALDQLTRQGHTVGTPLYMAPEQLSDSQVGPAADLYSLGVILFHALTRTYPFAGATAQVLSMKAKLDPPSVADKVDVSPDLAKAVDALLARDPAARPANAAAARALFQRARATSLKTPALRPDSQPTRRPTRPTAALPAGAPAPAPPAARRFGAVLVTGLALLAVVFALRPARVELSAPRVELTLRGATVRFTRTPPGPARLRVAQGSAAREVPSTAAAEHSVALTDLAPGPVTVQPLADGLAGAPATFETTPVVARDLAAQWSDDGLAITFTTPIAVTSRLDVRVHGTQGWRPEEATAPGLTHRFLIPARAMPISTAWRLEHRLGAETVTETPRLPPLQGYRMALLAWLNRSYREESRRALLAVAQVEQAYLGAKTTGAPVMATLRQFKRNLSDSWVPLETGGAGGLLDDPALPAVDRARLYEALGEFEDVDAIAQNFRLPYTYPFRRHYGPHCGPSRTAHYPGAHALPIALQRPDRTWPLVLTAPQPDGLSVPMQLTGKGADRVKGTLTLPKLPPGARVEIHAHARLPLGRFVRVRVNDAHDLRLTRPDREFPQREPADTYTAFDPAILREGENTFEFTCPSMVPVMEGMHGFLPDVYVFSPGFALRVQ